MHCTMQSEGGNSCLFCRLLNVGLINSNPSKVIILRILILWCCFQTSALIAQRPNTFGRRLIRYGQHFLNDSLDGGKPRLLLYPVFAYSPETSIEVGLSGLLLYQVKGKEENRLSELQAFTFATLNEQYGAWFEHFLYGDDDKWFFLGRLRFQRFPLYYYGTGPEAKLKDETILYADYTLIKERVLHLLAPNLFVGAEIDFQQLYNVRFANESRISHSDLVGGYGTRNFGIGAGIVYDNRKNALNVRNGAFAELAYLHYDPRMLSEFSFNAVVTDIRLFKELRPRQVLAFQAAGVFMGGEVPFNQLAMLGGESLMRGYYTGRFRDRNYLAAQIEYRWLPFSWSRRFGGAIFASAGTVAHESSNLLSGRWHPAAGVGVRFRIFPKKDIFLRADFAITPERTGFYLFTGEAF